MRNPRRSGSCLGVGKQEPAPSVRSAADWASALGRTGWPTAEAAGFSLQANAKTPEGTSHPDRNAQFEHINAEVKAFQAAGEPVISVDTKKKGVLQRHERSSYMN